MTSCCGVKVVFQDLAGPDDIGPRLDFTHVECACGAVSKDINKHLLTPDPAWSERDDGTYVFTASCGDKGSQSDIAQVVESVAAVPDGMYQPDLDRVIRAVSATVASSELLDHLSALAYNKWHFTQVPKWSKDRPPSRPVTRDKRGAPALSRYYALFDYDIAAQGVICCICDRTTGAVLAEARAERDDLETADEKHDLAESRAWALFQHAELVQEIEPGPAALIRALATDPEAMQRFNEFSPAGAEEYAC